MCRDPDWFRTVQRKSSTNILAFPITRNYPFYPHSSQFEYHWLQRNHMEHEHALAMFSMFFLPLANSDGRSLLYIGNKWIREILAANGVEPSESKEFVFWKLVSFKYEILKTVILLENRRWTLPGEMCAFALLDRAFHVFELLVLNHL